MPIYEYKCSDCGAEFEVIQKITEKPKRKCEKCGHMKAKRMISQTNFVLKGKGWYATDYGNRKDSKQESEPTPTPTPPKDNSPKDNSPKDSSPKDSSPKKKEVKEAS